MCLLKFEETDTKQPQLNIKSNRLIKVLVLTHVLQCSCSCILVSEAERVEALGTPEVHNLDGVEVGHHDVVGLEVEVEDTPVVEVLHALEDLDQVTHHVVLGVTEPYGWQKYGFNWCV